MLVFVIVHKTQQGMVSTAILPNKDSIMDACMATIKSWKCTLSEVDMYVATKRINITINIQDLEEPNENKHDNT